MINTLVVFVGAGLGGVLRHGVNSAASTWLGIAFPYGTFAVNVIGSFLMGLLVGYFALKGSTIPHAQLFLATGVLGGFTTFSAFSLDAIALWQRGEILLAAAYIIGSVILALLALVCGLWLARIIG